MIDPQKIEARMAELGLSQLEVSRRAKRVPSWFSNFLARLRNGSKPNTQTVGQVARALKCKPEDLT